MIVNPDHELTKKAGEHWYKILALALHKQGQTRLVITKDDLGTLSETALLISEEPEGLVLSLHPVSSLES